MAARAADNVVLQWDNALLAAIRLAPPGPTVVARSIAILHTAMFDAWSAYDSTALPTVERRGWRRPLEERTEANKVQAINYASYRAAGRSLPCLEGDLRHPHGAVGRRRLEHDNGSVHPGRGRQCRRRRPPCRSPSRRLEPAWRSPPRRVLRLHRLPGCQHPDDPLRSQPMAAPAGHQRAGSGHDPGLHDAAVGTRDAFRPAIGLRAPPDGPGPVPLGGVRTASGGPDRPERRADRLSESHRRILRGRPQLGVSAGALGALRPGRLPPRRPHARR